MTATTDRPEALRRRQLVLADGGVNLLDWGGDGPAVHFAHANGFNAETYAPILSPLRHEAHVLASDLRGHGATTLPADPAGHETWLTYPADLIRVLEAIGLGPYILAGHSMGGTTSLLVAANRPDLVRALVLFEPVAPYGPRAAGGESSYLTGALKRRAVFPDLAAVKRSYTGRGAFRTWPDEVLDAYIAGGFKPDPEGVRLSCDPAWEAANFRMGPPEIGADMLSRLACPIAVFHGTEASTTSPGFLDALQAAVPAAEITRIDGATHFLPMERPDLVQGAIRAAVRHGR